MMHHGVHDTVNPLGTPLLVPPCSVAATRFPETTGEIDDNNRVQSAIFFRIKMYLVCIFRSVERALRYLAPRRRANPSSQNEVGMLVHAATGGSYRGFCIWILWMLDFDQGRCVTHQWPCPSNRAPSVHPVSSCMINTVLATTHGAPLSVEVVCTGRCRVFFFYFA